MQPNQKNTFIERMQMKKRLRHSNNILLNTTKRPGYYDYLFYILLSLLFIPGWVAAKQNHCQSITKLNLPDTEITIAEFIPAGDYKVTNGTTFQAPEFCRVEGRIHPTADSDIKFEVWMPLSNWTGRYYQIGNGGFAGEIYYSGFKKLLQQGNAVAGTDTGHQDSPLSAQWALGHPEKVIDYGYRSLKVTSDNVKALIKAFYKRPPEYSYFTGCSGGGRQALTVAQRYPEDWDGIIAGAPPTNFTGLFTSFANNQHVLNNAPDSYITPNKLPTIQQAALSSCTAQAKVINGIATDPRYCFFNPEVLACQGEENDQCLTAAQLESTKHIIQGPRNSKTGEVLIAGFEPTLAETWTDYIAQQNPISALQFPFATNFFAYMVYGNADWKLTNFDLEHAQDAIKNKTIAGKPLPAVLNATNIDLSRFEKRKGKMLMYLGWGDNSISPRSGIAYYEDVRNKMGAQQTQKFFRLFMAPGMTHCLGGPGPNSFGQPFDSLASSHNEENNIIRALESWVEKGVTPEKLIATKYVNDKPQEGVAATGLLCPYPQIAVYQGEGSQNQATNFSCQIPTQ